MATELYSIGSELTSGGDYILMNDIVIISDFEINANGDVTIDLNGNDINIDIDLLLYSDNVTIKDSKGTGSVTINNYLYSDKGTVKIEGGTFNIGNIVLESTGKLVIEGGTFNQDVSKYVDTDKYSVTDNGNGTWTVGAISEDKNVCQIGDKKYTSLQLAIDAAVERDTINLIKDIPEENITINEKFIMIQRGECSYKGNVTLINGGSLQIDKEVVDGDFVKVDLGSVTATYDNGFKNIVGSDVDDVIVNQAINSTVNGGAGNDSIYLSEEIGSGTVINVGDGDDTIIGYTKDKGTIYAQYTAATVSGSDVLLTTEKGTVLILDAAGQPINLNGEETTISATATGSEVCAIGEEKYNSLQDAITASTATETITLLKDITEEVIISNKNINFQLDEHAYNGNVTLKNGSLTIGEYSLEGNTATATYKNGTGFTNIVGTDADDYITSRANKNVVIDGGKGKDTMNNYADNVTMNGGEGDDHIANNTGNNVVINGGEGDDELFSSGNQTTINGGAGSDRITLYNVTNNVINVGEGDDIITGYTRDKGTINVTYTESSIEGSDVILKTANGSVRIVEGLDKNVNISGVSTVFSAATTGNVCKIGDTEYEKLQDAVDAAENDEVITLIEDNTETLEIENQRVIIDVGNFSYKGNVKLSNFGSLQIGEDIIGVPSATTNATASYDNGFKNVVGSNGNDFIIIKSNNTTINGGAGNDTIVNNGEENASINGGAGNDSITNVGKNVTIDGGKGDDDILNVGENVIIYGAVGNDSITNNGKNVTIHSGDGDDFVNNTGENVSINSTTGNDTITNSGKNVIIDSGAGNDEIYNFTKNVTIDGGEGNDKISLDSGTSGLLKATSTMVSSSGSNLIIAGEGDDTIYGYTLQEGTIQVNNYTDATVEGKDVILTTSKGKVTIIDAANVTINVNGDDTVFSASNTGHACQIGTEKYESLQDAVNAAKDNDTITLLEENTDNVEISGKKVTFDVGEYSYKGDVTLSKAKLTIDEDNLQVANGSVTVTYDEGFKNIVGSDESDKIFNYAKDAVINMNAGDDRINNSAENVKIISGEGDDIVYNYGNNVTIEDGAGNDEIHLGAVSGNIINAGEGNDTIQGYNADKGTINAEYTAVSFGGDKDTDVILTNDKGTVTILDGADKNINLNGTDTIFAAPVYLCQIGDKKYEKLQDAIDAATPNQTITLLDNVTEDVELTSTFILIDTKNYAYKGTTKLNSNGKACSIAIGKDLVAILEGSATANYDDGFTSLVGSDSADSLFNYNAYVTVDGGARAMIILEIPVQPLQMLLSMAVQVTIHCTTTTLM